MQVYELILLQLSKGVSLIWRTAGISCSVHLDWVARPSPGSLIRD